MNNIKFDDDQNAKHLINMNTIKLIGIMLS